MEWTMFNGKNFPKTCDLYLVTIEEGDLRYVDLVTFTKYLHRYCVGPVPEEGFMRFEKGNGRSCPWKCINDLIVAWMPSPMPAEGSAR